MVDDRWVEVTPSQFPHEADGLRLVRSLLPNRGPFRAWTNFEFRDDRGSWAEIDLLVLAPDGLHLVELKYYSGRLRGNDQTWLRDGHHPEDSPLLLANRKAKRLRSKLMSAYAEWAKKQHYKEPPPRPSEAIPFIREAVFLHHPGMICELPDSARRDLYGLPEDDRSGALTPITDLFDGEPRPGARIYEGAVVGAMQLIGVRGHAREAGSYVLDPQPLEDGPGWQDWLATHKHLRNQRRRIRFRTVPEGSTEQTRSRARLLAGHELQVMQKLSHDAILRPEDYVDSELGPGLVYPYDPAWQRLDLWLAAKPTGFGFDAQLALIRQIAEALQYAHGKNVVHRRLNPHAILVRTGGDGRTQVRITDWQGVGRTDEATSTHTTRGVTALASLDAELVPAAERWVHDGFTAPEGVLADARNRLRLDVFGLGALAFYLLTDGQPPARARADLVARLRDQGGLDVSVELPAAPPALRQAILAATSPIVSERLADVAAFLESLDHAIQPAAEEVTDPLDAGPGAILDQRFVLTSRLGAGSTAVGLLVTDLLHPEAPARVLKVAIDDSAARRIEDEADTLRRIVNPRIVKLIEGPLDVCGRRALLLASAGRETLATHLGNRERLSLDLLERWGLDLLETVSALDVAGVIHRDIKPANLGVREDRGNRSKHLVLFDFSLVKAPASDTQAGTRPYLDPFLGGGRLYDSAAERYAAAVVLFEMATGHTPVYGDGLSEPSSIRDEATITAEEFDASARARLTAFFTRSLAREAKGRHHTADEMLLEWRACFPDSSVIPANADEIAQGAKTDTPLAQSGLTPRAISALEQLKVVTVGDLAAVDAVRLNRLPGSAVATRDEIKKFARIWRAKFSRSTRSWQVVDEQSTLPGPHECADTLLIAARAGKDDKAVALAAHLLGVTGTLDANATQPELAASLTPPVTRGRVSQLLGELQGRWATNSSARDLLDGLADAIDTRLVELGGVATFDELSRHLLGLMVATPDSADGQQSRLAEGLLRCTVDRRAALERAEADGDENEGGWFLRRREHQPLLVATRHDLLDVAESLGRRADALVAEANPTGTDELVAASRVVTKLNAILDEAATTAPGRAAPPYDGLRDGHRLARLAALLSSRTGASAAGELHHLELRQSRALREALPAIVPGQPYTAQQLRDRVRARFPDLPPLPPRTDLDRIVGEAKLGLGWDPRSDAYLIPDETVRDTTGLDSRPATMVTTQVSLAGPGAVGQRLLDSRQSHSFLALGVGALRMEKLVRVLRRRFDAVEFNLSAALMDALHETAAAVGISWADVLAADAEAPGSRAHQGLQSLAKRSLPAVSAAIQRSLEGADEHPVALVDASLLARHDGLNLLASSMDLATRRPTAVWLVVPQVHGNTGAMVDGRSLPLTAPSQYVPVPPDWIDSQDLEGRA